MPLVITPPNPRLVQRYDLILGVVDEATNPAAALNDARKGKSKGKGEAGLVASSTTFNSKSELEHSISSQRFRSLR